MSRVRPRALLRMMEESFRNRKNGRKLRIRLTANGQFMNVTRKKPGRILRANRDLSAAVIDWRKHLVSRRDVGSGLLCAKGTRVPVAVILDSLAEGATNEDIIRSYPSLKTTHIRAAIAYAADLAREEQLTPLWADTHKSRRKPARRTG